MYIYIYIIKYIYIYLKANIPNSFNVLLINAAPLSEVRECIDE